MYISHFDKSDPLYIALQVSINATASGMTTPPSLPSVGVALEISVALVVGVADRLVVANGDTDPWRESVIFPVDIVRGERVAPGVREEEGGSPLTVDIGEEGSDFINERVVETGGGRIDDILPTVITSTLLIQ